ncbi:MAG: chorismate mutase, partial [Candidatus Binataceae bacterium]
MASPPDAPKPTLADLRREIDRIDEAMHRLLMERGDIIETVIAPKKTAESGS